MGDMDTLELLSRAENILKEFTSSFSRPEETRLDAIVPAEKIREIVRALLIEGKWGYLSAITALDHADYETDPSTKEKKAIPNKGNLEVLYHFCEGATVVTLRVSLSYNEPVIDSIYPVISSASFYEREAMELMGIDFRDTPNTERLLLPDGWPEGVYPLRKAFTGLGSMDKE
jgi:NADH:ubiquinone oxidoreductase subunit C